jgi:hypothetical protein
MSNITQTKQGGGFPLHNDNINPYNTRLSFSVSESDSELEGGDKFNFRWLEDLLESHVGRLQEAIRRNEAYSLKPFPKYMNQKEVVAYLGHEKIFWILVEEYGLKPIRQEHRCNVYCSKQVEEKCIQFELNIAA